MMFFLNHGYRVIAHDRRGHGRSTQTADGHDMDHYADDLAALTTQTYKGFPHGMCTTQADTINADLLAFIKS
jgi:pimeloyl-ACP methyl ester carboxylesterase